MIDLKSNLYDQYLERKRKLMFQVEVRKAGFVENTNAQKIEFQVVLLPHTSGAAEAVRKIFQDDSTHVFAHLSVSDEGHDVIDVEILTNEGVRAELQKQGFNLEFGNANRLAQSGGLLNMTPTPLSDPTQESFSAGAAVPTVSSDLDRIDDVLKETDVEETLNHADEAGSQQ